MLLTIRNVAKHDMSQLIKRLRIADQIQLYFDFIGEILILLPYDKIDVRRVIYDGNSLQKLTWR